MRRAVLWRRALQARDSATACSISSRQSSSKAPVDNNSFVPQKPPPVRLPSEESIPRGMIRTAGDDNPKMTRPQALKTVPMTNESQSLGPFTTRLTGEQLEALSRCARGISLRFESWEIVDALVAAGFVERGVAGVVTVTPVGHEYLRTNALNRAS